VIRCLVKLDYSKEGTGGESHADHGKAAVQPLHLMHRPVRQGQQGAGIRYGTLHGRGDQRLHRL